MRHKFSKKKLIFYKKYKQKITIIFFAKIIFISTFAMLRIVYTMQLKAGYFTSGIESLKTTEAMARKVDALMESLSYFDLDTNIELSDTCDDPAVALMYNIVSRGAPTYASQFVEDILSTTIGKTLKRISDTGDISREIQKQEVRDMVFRALHVIDPRVRPAMPKTSNSKIQQACAYILNGAVPSQGDYIFQLGDTECLYENMFRFSSRFRRQLQDLKANPACQFLQQKCHLCFHAPYSDNTADGVAFHFTQDRNGVDTTDYITEEQISSLLADINIQGRVIVRDSQNPYDRTEELSNFTQSQYFDIIRQNYQSPLYGHEDGIEALQLALTPLAIARVQKVILEAINSGALSMSAKSWSICVIERDVPCAFLAIEDLRQHFARYFALENQGRRLPAIKLEIFHTEEFANTELNLLYQGSRDDVSEFNPLRRYDLLIDISVLRRASFDREVPPTVTDRYAVVRSAKSPSADSKLLFSDQVHYNIAVSADMEAMAANGVDDTEYDESDSDDDNDCLTEQEDALRFFLKNLFAKSDFIDGQLQSICRLLNGENILHVSAPASGKTLVMLFAALMKPGYSFVLPPTIAVMDSQFATLRGRRIDCCYYISPVLQNSQSRNMAVRRVVEGKSIITLISPLLIHDPYMRGVFAGINQLNIPIYYIMLDEAQRISLQTTEYTAYYQDIRNIIASNFDTDNTQMLRLGAFTSTLETNIHKEIAEKLHTDITIFYRDTFAQFVKPRITVHEVDLRGVGNTDDLDSYSRRLKQHEVETLLQPMLRKNSASKAVIYSITPPFDSVDVYGDSQQVCDAPTAHYLGDIDEPYSYVSSSVAYRSMKELSRFCETDSARVLSATYSAGLGVHASGIKRIVHMEPPLSLDAFCRANGRGAKGDAVQVDLYINTVPREYSSSESVRDGNGNIKTLQSVISTNFDTAANLMRLAKLNPGALKEKTIINELLEGVMFPCRTDRQNIIDAVYNEFGVEIDTDAEPMVNPYQLYIYTQGRSKSLGHIDFRNRSLHMPEMQFDVPLAEKIQSYILDMIVDNTDNPLDYLKQMESEKPAEECDGLQTALDAIMEGRKTELRIPFYNSYFEYGAQLIASATQTEVDPQMLRRCYNSTDNYDDYERMLQREGRVRVRSMEDVRRTEFKNLYLRLRNRKDTLRAVSRLKEIDVIDDYLVNPATGIVTLSMTKRSKDFYRMKLLPILQRNITRERMLHYISGIEEEKYLSIEKYTDVLIDFFYAEIYPLYEKQAQDASKFFESVLQRQKDDSISQELISQNLASYFASRYKCKFVYGDVETLPDNHANVESIVNTIERAGSNINSLMDLQQSIDLSQPENRTPSNKIIYGYCSLFTDRDNAPASRLEAYSHISDGLLDYRRKHTIAEFNQEAESITGKISAENYDLKDEASEVISIQVQSKWLKWFNSEVLKIQ